jgi:hypothetical protein
MTYYHCLIYLEDPPKEKKPLIDYSYSHVVTNFKYLDILRRKTMEKAVAK